MKLSNLRSPNTARSDLIRAIPEAQCYLEKFDELSRPLAVIKVGGAIIDNNEGLVTLIGAANHLLRLGFPPVIVYGGGKQIDLGYSQAGLKRYKNQEGLAVTSSEGISIVAEVLKSIGQKIVENFGGGVGRLFYGVFEAPLTNYDELGWVSSSPVLSQSASEEVLDSLRSGHVPVISCLGKVAVWNGEDGDLSEELFVPVNINGDDAALAVVKSLVPHRYLSVTPTGGVLDEEKRIITLLHPESLPDLESRLVISDGMAKKVKEATRALDYVEGVSILMPGDIIRELFTHAGEGTLIINHRGIIKRDPKAVDSDKVSELIESAFSKEGEIAKLASDYFKLPDIKSILITSQKYDAVAVIRDLGIGSSFNYICKIAVRPNVRGHGLSSEILTTAAREGNVIWRARVDDEDPANLRLQRMYENNSDGQRSVTSSQGRGWVVYWKNVTASNQELESAIEFVSNLEPTITRISTI